MSLSSQRSARAQRRAAKQLERTLVRKKIERAFTRTTEDFDEALRDLRIERAEKQRITEPSPQSAPVIVPVGIDLPKVHHMQLERGCRKSTLLALFQHYKAETGCVLVLHKKPVRHAIGIIAA